MHFICLKKALSELCAFPSSIHRQMCYLLKHVVRVLFFLGFYTLSIDFLVNCSFRSFLMAFVHCYPIRMRLGIATHVPQGVFQPLPCQGCKVSTEHLSCLLILSHHEPSHVPAESRSASYSFSSNL